MSSSECRALVSFLGTSAIGLLITRSSLAHTMSSSTSDAFRKARLIDYGPRSGVIKLVIAKSKSLVLSMLAFDSSSFSWSKLKRLNREHVSS